MTRRVPAAAAVRAGLLVIGVGAMGVGARLLWGEGVAELPGIAGWLAGVVVVHDGLIAPLTVGLGVALVRLVPPRWRAATTGGLVVLATLTVLAIPVLGRFGARPDNPTLLDRPYLAGWLAVAAVTLGGVLGWVLARRGGRSPAVWHAPGQDHTGGRGPGGAHPRGRRRPDGP